jgi:hypothetical protein
LRRNRSRISGSRANPQKAMQSSKEIMTSSNLYAGSPHAFNHAAAR